mmetsp:Transcript_6057/g.20170  ORF Transcript_6057/g.20170 Transcript_6057/m.20170 type:complete len:258 (-) Transcript_6057:881-1654(-)
MLFRLPAPLPGEGVTYFFALPLCEESGEDSISTLERCASATAACASALESFDSWLRLLSGEPSDEPGVPTANDPPCGVPNAPPTAAPRVLTPPLRTDDAFAFTPSDSSASKRVAGKSFNALLASSASPASRSHRCHAGAARSITSPSAIVASARVIPASVGDSSDTNISPSKIPPRKPPHTNTSGPTPAVVCRHRRLADAAASFALPVDRVSVTDHPAFCPADVFSTARDRASSTMLPPPSAPPLTCNRVPTKDTAC